MRHHLLRHDQKSRRFDIGKLASRHFVIQLQKKGEWRSDHVTRQTISAVNRERGQYSKFRNNGSKDYKFSFLTIYNLVYIFVVSLP